MSNEKNEIVLFENQDVKLEVNLKDETVWLNREQMSELFGRNIKTHWQTHKQCIKRRTKR